MKKSQILAGGKKFFTLEWGDSKPDSILGIHGLTANSHHMAAVSEFLSSLGWHVLAYDVRGRGESSPADKPSTMRSHAGDANEIINALPAKKVLLMGYSMGGYIAGLAAGLNGKVAGIVLFDGGGLCTREEATKLIPALARMEKVFSSPEEYVEAAKPTYAALGQPWNSYIEAAAFHEVGPAGGGKYKYRGDPERIKEDLLDIAEYRHAEVYARVKCPVLLIHAVGRLGQGAPLYAEAAYDLVRKSLPDLQFYQTKANHYTMMLEKQPELYEQVKAFVKKCGISAGV
jgi:pimeloyl-ACP methyl ester carboxylesterase